MLAVCVDLQRMAVAPLGGLGETRFHRRALSAIVTVANQADRRLCGQSVDDLGAVGRAAVVDQNDVEPLLDRNRNRRRQRLGVVVNWN